MSVDKSLRLSNQLARQRSVLTRAERIAQLKDEDRWEEEQSVFGLPKVRVRVTKRRHKAAAKPEDAEAAVAAEGEVPAADGAAPAPEAEKAQDKGKK